MRHVISNTLISVRDLLVTALPFILLGAALLIGAYFLLQPAPPKRIVFATGPEQSALAEFGKRYAAELRPHGIEVELLTTRGSLDNLTALGDAGRKVDVGFVQGGSSDYARTVDETRSEVPLVSLGSMFYEPVWIFYRQDAAQALPQSALPALAQRERWRVSFGADGSGTPGLMRKLLAANRINVDDLQPVKLEVTPAVVSLLGGELDAVAFVSAPEAPMVQMLLQTPGVKLLEFMQAEAYSRRFAFLSPVALPRGVADLERNVPPKDIPLVAPITSLVAREDTHPALIQLLVQAATRIHSSPGWIARSGQFPTSQAPEFPLAAEAERFYLNGPPFLQRYMPFWLANLIDRMWVVLFSIIAVMIPLSRILPPLYAFRIRRRIFRWYRQLREIETELEEGQTPSVKLLEELARLEDRIAHISVPLSHTHALYDLRDHISLVRRRIRGMPAVRPGG